MVSTSPVVTKRDTYSVTDIDILQYALTLEHLEDKFYREGLANYTHQDFIDTGFADPFYANLQRISADETTHVTFLSTALGSQAVTECIYSFPSYDVASFVALASVLEGVGVSAYLGAAASIANPGYLTAAGSILTVESRHSAYIRASLQGSPSPQPFDVPLDFDEVYSLAGQFILKCPSTNTALSVKAFPALEVREAGSIHSGDTITLLTPGYEFLMADNASSMYFAFLTVTGPLTGIAIPVEGGFQVVVPEGINGQSYVVLTVCEKEVNDETIAAGPAIIEITNPTT
ncbi:hypothetical protein NHQ30_009802 [Ciborinia camelliae]|nr:hypothetical protein NHQ30_009802 [Ciborinia camelliae]